MTLGFLLLAAAPAFGQHEHHSGAAPTPTPPAAADDPMKGMSHEESTSPSGAPNLFQSDMSLMNGMVPRDPDAGGGRGGWHVMDLGIARLSFNRQGGASGGSDIESSNWNMIHAQRTLGPGRLSLMMMNSLEPATYPDPGSRELFQTGESARGRPLVDRQHPHDFFMNLSATYRWSLGVEAGAWIQLAPVGEPALGPTAFMHRASAGENLTAPIGHHWEDSTHISYDVVTAGGGWKWVAVEASAFHGREPDEHRWDIEGGRVDSASVRARLFPGGGWSAEISHGFLKTPEALEPGDTHRTTAALSYGAAGDRPFAATLLWGRNDERAGSSDAFLLEAAWRLTRSDQLYGRVELVQKDRALLATKELDPPGRSGAAAAVRVGAYTAGYLRDVEVFDALRTGLGADVTAYGVPSALKAAYGRFPLSTHAFLRVRWGAAHAGAGHAGHSM